MGPSVVQSLFGRLLCLSSLTFPLTSLFSLLVSPSLSLTIFSLCYLPAYQVRQCCRVRARSPLYAARRQPSSRLVPVSTLPPPPAVLLSCCPRAAALTPCSSAATAPRASSRSWCRPSRPPPLVRGRRARRDTSSSGRGQRRPFVSTRSRRAPHRRNTFERREHVGLVTSVSFFCVRGGASPGSPDVVVRRPPRRGTTSAAATRTDFHEMEPAEQEWRPSSSRASPTTPAACPRPHRPIRLAMGTTRKLETTSPRTHAAQANKARARRERRSVSSSRTLAKRSQSG